jgi:5-methyltetrahydropteroyltriglutamate--homocysteine methyltransferase
MRKSDARILTTHAGSLPRPLELTSLYTKRSRGQPVDAAHLADVARKAVPWSVGEQRKAGLDVVCNGEQQRESFVLYLRHRLAGMGGQGSRQVFTDIDAFPKYKAERTRMLADREAVSNVAWLPKCVGPIRYIGQQELQTEIADFEAAMKGVGSGAAEAFFTAASPGILAAIVNDEHYGDLEAYLDAIASALRVEYEAIVKAGFVLQIDAPDLALERHGSYGKRPLADFQQFVALVVAAINKALAGIPRDRVRLHVCWGNYEGPHVHDVPLRDILPIILRADVGAIYLPFANPRHNHEIKVLRDIPLAKDQVLIGGVIDTLTNLVEHPEVVADRIERMAEAVGDPTRVMAGTDCGFDTSAGMGRVAEDVVWAKLKAMSEGAALASKRLFK